MKASLLSIVLGLSLLTSSSHAAPPVGAPRPKSTASSAMAATSASAPVQSDHARAELKNAKGETQGVVTFEKTPKGVRLVAEVSGLKPGPKGIHIHEKGDCLGPDFKSAGSHLKTGTQHHGLSGGAAHAGDLPNLDVGKDGKGKLDTVTDRISLGNGPDSVYRVGGTAVIVHAGEDDQKSDPSGNSGDRLLCGIIQPEPSSSGNR